MIDEYRDRQLFNKTFSHVYVEKEAFEYDLTKEVIGKFKNSSVIEIECYKSVFNKSRQNIILQKKSQSLILAVKHGNFVYKGAPFCQSFGNENFYYTSLLMGCIYDCEYCYLTGMYPSADIVLFVNIEDFFREIENTLADNSTAYYCISYDTDLLALDGIFNLSGRFIEFCSGRPGLKIELRTKSSRIPDLSKIEIGNRSNLCNFIMAFTLSPDSVSHEFEHGAPDLKMRLEAVKNAADAGFPVRLIFDPLIKIADFERIYGDFFEYVFKELKGIQIYDAGIGVFRISDSYLSKMYAARPYSKITAYPYERINGAASYDIRSHEKMLEFSRKQISKYAPDIKIFAL